MPRACDCRAIHDIASRDPRILTLCLAAAMLWERLAGAALAYGGIIPFAETQRVSILVRASVSEVETHLETLVRDGLVLREGDTLVLPELAGLAEARAARARAAQENGRKGGRPRKGETPEDMHRRRQGHLLLPVSGTARAETQETQPESSRASAALTDQIPSAQSDARDVAGFARECAEAAGLDPAKSWVWADVQALINAGIARPTILATIQTVAARAAAKGIKPGSFRYFVDAIRQAHAEAQAAAAQPADRPEILAYNAAMQAWIRGGMAGPGPVHPDHQVAA
jgi:hypothetical protein